MGCRASQCLFNKTKARIAFESASAVWWKDHSNITKCYQRGQFPTSFTFYPSMQVPTTNKVSHFPALPIWWIVMYGSLSCGKSSITSTQGKLRFPIGSTCQVSQLTRVKLCFPIVSTWQVSQFTPVKLRFPIGSACQASQIKWSTHNNSC